MTVIELLDALKLAGCRVRVQGPRLAVGGRVPDELRGPLAVLHSGCRAALLGKVWVGYGEDLADTRVSLSLAELVPVWVEAVGVQDEPRDRLPPSVKESHPELFALPGRVSRRREPPGAHLPGMAGPADVATVAELRRARGW